MDITTKNRIMFLVILTLACGENSYLHLFAECFALKSAKRTMQKKQNLRVGFVFFLTPLDKGDNIGYNIEDNSEVQYGT